MKNPLKTVRRSVQLLALLAFIWLLAQARWFEPPGHAAAPWFLRMDPLAALVTWLAPTPTWLPRLFPALLVLVVTVVLGRVFCGWVCPLGTTLDLTEHLLLRRRKGSPAHLNRPRWKYALLGLSLAAALFGAQLAWLLDPIPLFTRTASLVAYPVLIAAYNAGVVGGRPVLRAVGLHLYPTDMAPTFALNLAVLAVFVAILALSALSRRYWCRTLCPLGALLAFVGRFSLLKRRVEGCVQCRRCAGECKMGAVAESPGPLDDYGATLAAECIQCYDCLVCPKEGIAGISLRGRTEGVQAATGASRRHFLTSVGLGALYGAAAVTGAGRRATSPKLIRPPGAIIRISARGSAGDEPPPYNGAGIRTMTESEFRDLCLRCGECMRACVTGGLQPAVAEAGFDGLFTPVLVPKLGHCEQGCTACGQVCPSGALGEFLVAEKKSIQIGLATVVKDRCLAWRPGAQYRLCLVCNEHCSYQAVELLKEPGGISRPVVNADTCVGCGECERFCPIKPEAAIVVSRADAKV